MARRLLYLGVSQEQQRSQSKEVIMSNIIAGLFKDPAEASAI